ncbi:MAG TPA: YraN family protein [Firmicutes bacterium]|jgi:putative endonuclease|nr:YraN family protein [Bacillota bacterium]HBR28497.1 YraN family protein [Bacillota bacterium]HBR34835.1 YraN family protein [Bacillota bacterium]
MERRRLGNYGELIARRILEDRGYLILHHKYYTRYGELDLVAKEGNELVFIEVKTRIDRSYGSGLEAITKKKRAHLIRTAFCYLQQHHDQDLPCRFDIIALKLDQRGQLLDYQLIKDAFGVEGGNYY